MENIDKLVPVAILIEAVVTNASMIFGAEEINLKNLLKNWKYILALVLSVGIAFNYNIDLFSAFGLVGTIPYLGAILTGFVFARGANFVNDLIGKLRS